MQYSRNVKTDFKCERSHKKNDELVLETPGVVGKPRG
jgi:hypothetical protein